MKVKVSFSIFSNLSPDKFYEVTKQFDDGDVWVLTPDFAQPWGYDGERVDTDRIVETAD